VTQALEALEKSGRAERTKDGWRITTVAFFGDVGGDDAKP